MKPEVTAQLRVSTVTVQSYNGAQAAHGSYSPDSRVMMRLRGEGENQGEGLDERRTMANLSTHGREISLEGSGG